MSAHFKLISTSLLATHLLVATLLAQETTAKAFPALPAVAQTNEEAPRTLDLFDERLTPTRSAENARVRSGETAQHFESTSQPEARSLPQFRPTSAQQFGQTHPRQLPSPVALETAPRPLATPSSQVRRDSSLQPVQGNDQLNGAGEFPADFEQPVPLTTIEPAASGSEVNAPPRMDPPVGSLFDAPPTQPSPAIGEPSPTNALEITPLNTPQPSPTPQFNEPPPFGQQSPAPHTTQRPTPEIRPAPQAFSTSDRPNLYNPPAESRQQAVPETGLESVHEVQPGENYWTISRQHYGTARYFAALAEYNRHRIPRPDRMKPGMFVLIPEDKVLEQRYPQIAGIRDMKPSPESLEPSGYFIAPNGQPMYRIGKGDTLTDIAETHLGRTARWTQIVGMNRDILRDANSLKIGMVLRLPHDASQVALAPKGQSIR